MADLDRKDRIQPEGDDKGIQRKDNDDLLDLLGNNPSAGTGNPVVLNGDGPDDGDELG